MSDNRTDLPSPSAPNFNQRLRETIQTYLGRQGNPLDRGLTLRDLLETGILKLRDGFTLKPGGGSSIPPLEPGPSLADEPDLTPPPTPTGFIATAAISHIIVEHDAPIYTQGRGHLRTRLYGKIVNPGDPLPTFADATEIAQFDGTVYAHPSNPATTWRLWIKWETIDNVLSVDPAGGTNGLVVTTGQDVGLLLKALTGQITESELYQTLQSRINLIDGPDTLAGSVAARIRTEEIARTNADGALSSQVTTLSTRVDNNTSAIQTEATVRASQTGELYAKYSIKLDVNGYVTGWAMNNNGSTGDMIVLADKFAVGAPGGGNIIPFVVNTTPQTINGVYVPAGTYMDAAYIKNGTITNAKIGNAAIDDAKIANLSAGKITAGSIAVGQYIQSAGYVAGSSGWRINGDGNAELSNATVRGTVYASAGQFSGTLLGGSATGYSSGIGFYAGAPAVGSYQFRVGDPTGNRIGWDGSNVNLISQQLTISNGSASFSGSLNAASGTFEGSLEGATGTFAGTLAAGVLDSAAFDSIKYPYPNSGTFNLEIPELKAGWTAMHMRLTILGAGGGGGGGAASGAPNRNPTSSGGGGGAGQKNVYVVTSGISPRTPLTIQVGYGGNPGVGDSTWDGNSVAATPGSNGGNSSVTIGGSVYSASGGAGGGAGTSALADSFVGSGVGTGGGSGGSLGGQSGTGGYAISAAGGAGGSSEFGTGGSGGAAAYQYAGGGANGGVGAGGGGGGADASHPDLGYAAGGGYGGKGYVLVEFYDPNTVVLNSRYSALIQWLDGIGQGAVPSAAR